MERLTTFLENEKAQKLIESLDLHPYGAGYVVKLSAVGELSEEVVLSVNKDVIKAQIMKLGTQLEKELDRALKIVEDL